MCYIKIRGDGFMTVKELIEKLQNIDESKEVYVSTYDFVNCFYVNEEATQIKETENKIYIY